MIEDANYLLTESIELIERYGTYLLSDSRCDVNEEWKTLSPVMMCMCDVKEKYSASERVFNECLDKIGASENQDVDPLQMYQTEISKILPTLKLGENNEIYSKFQNLFVSVTSEKKDESEIRTVSESVNTIDPITKLPLTDPVKNTKCGHVYEKASIYYMLSKKKSVKCPIPGCVAGTVLNEDCLVPDVALKRHLENSKKN